MFGARVREVIGPAGIALRDTQSGHLMCWVLDQPSAPTDDVASVRVSLSLAVVTVSMLPFDGPVLDDLLARLDWRLCDHRAPR